MHCSEVAVEPVEIKSITSGSKSTGSDDTLHYDDTQQQAYKCF